MNNLTFRGGGGVTENNIEGGLPKKRGLGQFVDLRGLGKKECGGVLRGDWYPNAHYAFIVAFRKEKKGRKEIHCLNATKFSITTNVQLQDRPTHKSTTL